MTDLHLKNHPIISVSEKRSIEFSWNGSPLVASEGETIAAALLSNGIIIFGHHPKDHSPQSLFCANGQCAQCLVIANGLPVKACVEKIQPAMQIYPSDGLPQLPPDRSHPSYSPIKTIPTSVLILGGGPAGLSSAIELGKINVPVILVEDKSKLGGKLVLQTHRFFGSVDMVFAGTRGIEIAAKLAEEVSKYPSVKIWTDSTALAVFSDRSVGILRNGTEYILVKPEILLSATGAREKSLVFSGNTIPGILGAGAFQTLVNRDLVKFSNQLVIIGGGNVGLIAGYHALQAGIQVAALVEAMPECGGYKVHKDKLTRLGVPIYTSHTILQADGIDRVESVTICAVNPDFKPIKGTERRIPCDSVLIAVGLDPVDEFHRKAVEFGFTAFSAGDAEEIAEASAAMITGKIRGREIARALGHRELEIPEEWSEISKILKSKPGITLAAAGESLLEGVEPVIHCTQEIPCDPCSRLCDRELIRIAQEDIRQIPRFIRETQECKGCFKCLIGCPGLAITLVDSRKDPEYPVVTIPVEFGKDKLKNGDLIHAVNVTGSSLGEYPVIALRGGKSSDGTWLLQLIVPKNIAKEVAGVQVQGQLSIPELDIYITSIPDTAIVCRCERVSAGEIRGLIRSGYTDINEIKAFCRAGMGACGGKTCLSLINRIFREEGISSDKVTQGSSRPLFIETSLSAFAGFHGDSSD